MTKKWFAGSFFFSILIMFSVVLIFNVGTAQAYYQVQSGIKIICCTKNYTLCLDTEAKKMKNPDTNQLFANYNAALQYDSFNGTELFQTTINGLCYTQSLCFDKQAGKTCDQSAPDLCVDDQQCNLNVADPLKWTKFCDIDAQPNNCIAKKANDKMCTGSNQCVSGFCSIIETKGFCKPPICVTWTYSPWTACVNGMQSRIATDPLPKGCEGGQKQPLSQDCVPGFAACSSWTYSAWGECNNQTHQRTRTILTSSPEGCQGGTPELSQPCGPGVIACSQWTYSGWGPCVNGTQARAITTSSPAGCIGGNPQTTQSCTVTCTSWTYSTWTTCEAGNQTRQIQTSLPANCVGGTPEVLTRSCESEPTGCTGGCDSGTYCDGKTNTCVPKKKAAATCNGAYQCDDGFCYANKCSPAQGSDCPSFTGSSTAADEEKCKKQTACYWESNACSTRPGFGNDCTKGGEYTTDAGNCKEGSCIEDAGKSICRKTCSGKDCPAGYYCFGTAPGTFCKEQQKEGGDCVDGGSCISGKCESGKCKGSTPPAGTGGTTPAPAGEFELPNFLGIDDPNAVVGRVIKYVIGFAGSIAMVTFMYGGALWLVSAGRMDYVTKGKNFMIWAAIGLAAVFGSYILVDEVLKLFGQ